MEATRHDAGVSQMPRILDLRAFVQARQPEVGVLLQSVKSLKGAYKFGAPGLVRQLRRRATSHRRYHHGHARPNVRLARLYPCTGPAAKRARLQPIPETPSAAALLPSAETAAEPHKQLRPSNRPMRRRPARMLLQHALQETSPLLQLPQYSSNSTQAWEQVTDQRSQDAQVATQLAAPLPSTSSARPLHSQPGTSHLETHAWLARRMCMHRSLWGHSLAIGAPGRGRGSRSFLHNLREHCVMHDASYWGVIQLSGHQREVAAVLRAVSDPDTLDQQLSRAEVVCGAAEWKLLIHMPGEQGAEQQPSIAQMHGQGSATTSIESSTQSPTMPAPGTLLGPAHALWVPHTSPSVSTQPAPGPSTGGAQGAGSTDGVSGMQGVVPASQKMQAGASASGASQLSSAEDEDGWYPQCSLLLWVHAAAYQDVAQALMQAGAVPLDQPKSSSHAPVPTAAAAHQEAQLEEQQPQVYMRSLSHALRRIEVVGKLSTSVVCRVVQAASRYAPYLGSLTSMLAGGVQADGVAAGAAGAGLGSSSSGPPQHPSAAPGDLIWESATQSYLSTAGEAKQGLRGVQIQHRATTWSWPQGCAVGVTAVDPRLLPSATSAFTGVGGSGRAGTATAASSGSQPPLLGPRALSTAFRQWPESGDWTQGAGHLLQPSSSTGKPSAVHAQPLGEAQVAALRGGCRRAAVGLPVSSPQFRASAGVAVIPAAGGGPGSQPGTHAPQPLTCPVLLIKAEHAPGMSGWSLILPAGWVMPFWSALSMAGARPAGQREWGWACMQAGVPLFPYSFPHTPAGSRRAQQQGREQAAAAARRPLGHEPPLGSALPYIPWSLLGSVLQGGPGHPAASQRHDSGEPQQQQPRPGAPASMGLLSPQGDHSRRERRRRREAAAAGGEVVQLKSSSKAQPQAAKQPSELSALAKALHAEHDKALQARSESWGIINAPIAVQSASGTAHALENASGGVGSLAAQQPRSLASLPDVLIDLPHGSGKGKGPVNNGSQLLSSSLATGSATPAPPAADAPAQPQPPLPQAPQVDPSLNDKLRHLRVPPHWNVLLNQAKAHALFQQGRGGSVSLGQTASVASPGGSQSQVYARVQVVGKGVCLQGAQVVCLIQPSACRTPTGAGPGSSGVDGLAGAPTSPPHALVLGYAVAGHPRGVHPGVRSQADTSSPHYPGGLALCDAQCLADIMQQQQGAGGVSPGGSEPPRSSGRAGEPQSSTAAPPPPAGGQGSRENQRARLRDTQVQHAWSRPIRVLLRNPGSSVYRFALLHPLFKGDEWWM